MTDLIIAFINYVKQQHSSTVKYIQSDGGGEYMCSSLQSFFKAEGIIHLLSCPGTPEQNDMDERKHRHVVETSLTLLAHSKLLKDFWFYSFATAVHLINQLPSKPLSSKSPYELIFNHPPIDDHLRVFGCICYPYMQPFGLRTGKNGLQK